MKEELKKRFLWISVDVYKALRGIQFPHSASDAKRQLIRSSSSAAANYRSACRAKSAPDFLNKLKIVEEELDESIFWIEFLIEINVGPENSEYLLKELNELLSIIVSSIKTTRSRIANK